MNQAFHLYRLQQIDSQIDQISNSLAEIEQLLSDNKSVDQAKHALGQIENELTKNSHDLKQVEFSVKEQQIKISQSESTLYSGKVRNPKELQDLQKEIASLKKHLATLEDNQLEIMLEIEENEEKKQAALDNLNQVKATFAEKSAGLLGQKEQLLHNLDRLMAERTTAAPMIDKDTMRLYDSIRKKKNGVAVTTAQDGACSVCGATIRPMEMQSARSAQELAYCSTCGRILYVG